MFKEFVSFCRCRGKNMSCHLISNSFDRLSYSLFVLGEEIQNFLILRRFVNVEYTKRQFWDLVSSNTMPWHVKGQCDGFRVRPRFSVSFRVCDDYFGLYIPICDLNLIRSDLKSEIGSRLIGLVWYESSISPKKISKSRKWWPKILDFFYSALFILVGCTSENSCEEEGRFALV